MPSKEPPPLRHYIPEEDLKWCGDPHPSYFVRDEPETHTGEDVNATLLDWYSWTKKDEQLGSPHTPVTQRSRHTKA